MARTTILVLFLALPFCARAEESNGPLPLPMPAVKDALFKGVVGKALDALPMDPRERVLLQRTNAVVSSTLTGRSLALWAGLSNPILLIGGLVWGLYAASNIKENRQQQEPERTIADPPGRLELAWAQGAED